MRDIYEEAELSPGAVYHYFASKDDIIRASFDFDFHRSVDVFSAALESNDAIEAISGLFDFFFRGLEGAAVLGAGRVNVQGWGEALINPQLLETVQQVMNNYLDVLSRIVRKGQEAGQIDRSLNPVSVGQLMLSLYYGLELQKALDPGVDVGEYTVAAKALLLSGLRKD